MSLSFGLWLHCAFFESNKWWRFFHQCICPCSHFGCQRSPITKQPRAQVLWQKIDPRRGPNEKPACMHIESKRITNLLLRSTTVVHPIVEGIRRLIVAKRVFCGLQVLLAAPIAIIRKIILKNVATNLKSDLRILIRDSHAWPELMQSFRNDFCGAFMLHQL
jgi:hypothetical protein